MQHAPAEIRHSVLPPASRCYSPAVDHDFFSFHLLDDTILRWNGVPVWFWWHMFGVDYYTVRILVPSLQFSDERTVKGSAHCC